MQKVLVSAFFVLQLASAPCLAQTTPDFDTLKKEALGALQTRDLLQAQSKFEKLLKLAEGERTNAERTVDALVGLATVAKENNKPVESEAYLVRAAHLAKMAAGEESKTYGSVQMLLAIAQFAQGKFRAAAESGTLAVNAAEKGNDDIDLAHALTQRGSALERLSQNDAAEEDYRRALELYAKHDQPARMAIVKNNLGVLYIRQAKLEKAEQLLKEALVENEKAGEFSTAVSTNLGNLALYARAAEKFDDAEEYSKRALVIDERVTGKDSPRVAKQLINLAGLYFARGKYSDAESCMLRARNILDSKGVDIIDKANVRGDLGALYFKLGDDQKAADYLDQALAIYESGLSPDHPLIGKILVSQGRLLQKKKDYKGAEAKLLRALKIDESNYGRKHTSTASTLDSLGVLSGVQGNLDKAEDLFNEARAINQAQKPDGLAVAENEQNLGILYARQKRYEEAEKMFEHSLAIQERHYGNTMDLYYILNNMANLAAKRQDMTKSQALKERARKIYEDFKARSAQTKGTTSASTSSPEPEL